MAKHKHKPTLQTHIVRVNQLIDYIEQNLEKDLPLNTLAKKAFYSPYHFHRIFTNLYNETPLQFITRKRLEKILWLLLKDKKTSIQSLAADYGFNSPVSFSKSFKKHFGISASALRGVSKSEFNRIVRQNSKIGKEKVSVEEYFRNIEKVKTWMETAIISVESKIVPEQKLVAVRSQGGFELSDLAFGHLRNWASAENILSSRPRQWLLVIHDNPAITEVTKLSHSACLKLETSDYDMHDKMASLIIPKGRFLVGTFEIYEREFPWAWGGMSIWLLENGFCYRDGFYYEVFYSESVFDNEAKHKVDICIPIE